ncbi:hypothetical protein B0H13DRAFT_2276500 [Mycena leptocephala]|nr:hypothetical protein B0H13DRAFT_2276500 [Mycena leptocephala]
MWRYRLRDHIPLPDPLLRLPGFLLTYSASRHSRVHPLAYRTRPPSRQESYAWQGFPAHRHFLTHCPSVVTDNVLLPVLLLISSYSTSPPSSTIQCPHPLWLSSASHTSGKRRRRTDASVSPYGANAASCTRTARPISTEDAPSRRRGERPLAVSFQYLYCPLADVSSRSQVATCNLKPEVRPQAVADNGASIVETKYDLVVPATLAFSPPLTPRWAPSSPGAESTVLDFMGLPRHEGYYSLPISGSSRTDDREFRL